MKKNKAKQNKKNKGYISLLFSLLSQSFCFLIVVSPTQWFYNLYESMFLCIPVSKSFSKKHINCGWRIEDATFEKTQEVRLWVGLASWSLAANRNPISKNTSNHWSTHIHRYRAVTRVVCVFFFFLKKTRVVCVVRIIVSHFKIW